MTNHVNPTTTDTRELSRRQHNFAMRDAKGREHGVCVTTWSAVLDGARRYFGSLQKTRDRVEFGGEAKHEHYDTAELRDHHTARLVDKLYRQREREACAACEPIGVRSVEVLAVSGHFTATDPQPQNLPKDVALGAGVLRMPNGETHAVTDVSVTIGGEPFAPSKAPVWEQCVGKALEQGSKDGADIAASFGPSGELELKPLTEEGARALLDAGVSDEQLAAELADKGSRHHARQLVSRAIYAQELADNAKAHGKRKTPAAIKRAARLERIRKRLEA